MLQQRSCGSVKVISINRNKLLTELKAIARQICVENSRVKSVRLFGSIARGSQLGTSDVDILIILSGNEKIDALEQIRLFYPHFKLPIGVDLLVYVEEQIMRCLQAEDAFITQIWEESLLLSSQRV